MHKILFLLLILSCSGTKKSVVKQKESSADYQTHLKAEYLNPETSPLKEEELKNFKGIEFFPIDDNYKVEAEFSVNNKLETVEFATSTNRVATYKKYGTLSFIILNKSLQLVVYQSYPVNEKYSNHLFVPFNDHTNGFTSYGGGRYLDLQLSDIQNNKITIDFNKAYNPYCAYSVGYSCPIPPIENKLDIAIKAGVFYTSAY